MTNNGEIGIEEVVVDILDEDETIDSQAAQVGLNQEKPINNCINEFARHYNKKIL